ncbi:MAG: UDP-N-acetylmuramoyl-tripeptide--D-alanyl-D-alanine ligase [Bacteroidetes bacterium]|nr:UDP-N-acetylmuramoyl-tripeptide--D-alanyl-D-alanine ligase [Bacteroidota bacterium]
MFQLEIIYQKLVESKFKICTDTRKIEKDCVFFALKGENFDGNEFVKTAIENGAKYAITDNKNYENNNIIYVKNVLETLQKLANYHRHKLNCKVIAIGGSNGKTTTKELMYSVFSKQFKTTCTKGNLNNHIGVPLTLLSIDFDTQIAIIELGANKAGDIEELCNISEPDWGLITNIGKEHLEGFKSIEGVAKAEGELYNFLMLKNGVAFVNLDDECLCNMAKKLKNVYWYSAKDKNANLFYNLIQDLPEIVFEFNGFQIKSNLTGFYNFENIMAAIAVAHIAGVTTENIKCGIEYYKPQNKRSQIIKSGSTLVFLDAYNANPSSMEKALENFARINYPNKIAILGDMFEMGNFADDEHKNIYKLAKSLGFNKLVVAGLHFCKQAKTEGDECYKNAEEINLLLKNENLDNTAIFIKGSRGMAMENTLNGIINYNS